MAIWVRHRLALAAVLGVAGVCCTIFGIMLIVAVPGIVRDQVTKNVRLDPSSMTFSLWKNLPVPFFFSVYLFEVMNPKDVLKGAKPSLRERGPYVYSEVREKTNITFNDNYTVSFLEIRQLQFEPDLSNGTEEDYIVMPNVLVQVASILMEDASLPMKLTISSTFTLFGQGAFMNRTVGEILWGYNDSLINFLSITLPGLLPIVDGKFGILAKLNNSDSGLFTVFTGMDDVSKVHMVDSWNGKKKVSYWNSDQCNMINGTYGEMWPPMMTPSTPLEFYSPDSCRSMRLAYKESGIVNGIPAFRYVAPKTLFANGTEYPPNEGFCPCRVSGIQNLSNCAQDAPMFISQPHFYNADPVLLDTVDGLHPSEEKHGMFLDIHPTTGIPLNVSVQLQLNLYMKEVPGIIQTGKIKEVVFPLLWFREAGRIEGPVLDDFYTKLVLIPTILYYAQYCLVALGCFLLIGSLFFIFMSKTGPQVKMPQISDPRNKGPPDSGSSPLLQEHSSPTAKTVVLKI